MVCFICFFFFFQAEDGIRDADVTGVQTCALPILDLATREASADVPDTADDREGRRPGGEENRDRPSQPAAQKPNRRTRLRRTYLWQPKMPIDPKLEPFNALVGRWEIEATHPMFPSTIVHGT